MNLNRTILPAFLLAFAGLLCPAGELKLDKDQLEARYHARVEQDSRGIKLYSDTAEWDAGLRINPPKGELFDFYNTMLPAITKATSLLERMRPVSISAPVKRAYMAEVRCLRAMWAYDLYDLYGTVPIITDPDIALEPEVAADYNPERPTVEWYVDFIESELKEAEENLKARSEQSGSDILRRSIRCRTNRQ